MKLEFLDGYKPSDLGFDPVEFPEYRRDKVTDREVQLEVIEFGVYCDKRFAAACAPTGLGKSLVPLSMQRLMDRRTVVLTATKGLQDQYRRAERYGLVDIRGRANYQCMGYPGEDCKSGGLKWCVFRRGNGCSYEDKRGQAKQADIVSANYAYWFAAYNGLENDKKPIELLVLDEAHVAADLLADHLSVRVYEEEIKGWIDPRDMGDGIGDWKRFVEEHIEELKLEFEEAKETLQVLGGRAKKSDVTAFERLEKLVEKFDKIASIEDDWVCELRLGTKWGRIWAFDVVWPGRYAEKWLFRGIEKVVLMSATLNRKHLSTLGIGEGVSEFRSWPKIFPKNRCPVYYLPAKTKEDVAIKITRKTTEENKRLWVEHMDRLMESRLDRRIIVITTSYDYQKYIMEHSRLARYMMGNTRDPDSDSAMEVFEQFIAAPAPVILCSPSFGTGWSFDNDRAEFMVISKVPLKVPGGASKVQAARLARDPQLAEAETMTDLVQWAGRLQRSEMDRGEVVIADATWAWFGRKNKVFAPEGFVDGVRGVVELPPPPEKLKGK